MLLEDTYDVVGSVTNGRDLIDAVKRLKPDVAVTDISMPVMDGIDALRQLRREGDMTKVVFVTMHTDAQIALEAFRSGASGYVLKHAAGDELISAIRAALKDQTYLTPLIANKVVQLVLHRIGDSMEPEKQELVRTVATRPTAELIQLAIATEPSARRR
jgi:DNA-binding NarL/FixJ family response regulator